MRNSRVADNKGKRNGNREHIALNSYADDEEGRVESSFGGSAIRKGEDIK